MPNSVLSVEGPEFVELVARTREIVDRLEQSKWDFEAAKEVFAPKAAADVVGKEIVTIHDGRRITRIGRLTMIGSGPSFNLMGPIPAMSEIRVSDSVMLDEIADQLGSRGVHELDGAERLRGAQRVDFFNHTMFFELRDLVFWNVLHGTGCFPSTLEHMAKAFQEGKVVQNVRYRPAVASGLDEPPVLMQAACMMYSFPSPVVEWMDRPLFGGSAKETLHTEYLVTPDRSDMSHPYLELQRDGVVEFCGQRMHVREFAGVAPKDGMRDDSVPAERAE